MTFWEIIKSAGPKIGTIIVLGAIALRFMLHGKGLPTGSRVTIIILLILAILFIYSLPPNFLNL